MNDEAMLDAFYAWLDATSGDRPKSLSGAVGYNEMELEAFAAGYAAKRLLLDEMKEQQ